MFEAMVGLITLFATLLFPRSAGNDCDMTNQSLEQGNLSAKDQKQRAVTHNNLPTFQDP